MNFVKKTIRGSGIINRFISVKSSSNDFIIKDYDKDKKYYCDNIKLGPHTLPSKIYGLGLNKNYVRKKKEIQDAEREEIDRLAKMALIHSLKN